MHKTLIDARTASRWRVARRLARFRVLASRVMAWLGCLSLLGASPDAMADGAPAGTQPATTMADSAFEVPGLEAPAEILVDRWGVPHIYAATQYDAFFVQGFNAARDRLWQIDLWRRRGLGQLAEVFGPQYVAQDAAARLFLYRGSMRDEWLAYGSDAKRIAERFVAGINAYIALTRADAALLPPEFALLGYAPATWAAEDVVRIRSHGLWRNLTSEVARAQVACRHGLAADAVRKQLRPAWSTRIPDGLDPCVVTDDVLATYRLATAAVRFVDGRLVADVLPDGVRDGLGSNNWVVAPSRTATGRPLLANDPHRAHAVPSLRYIAHLVAPGLDVIGAGEPALPGISIGHNERIAFGLTIFGLDHEDLYVYRTDPRRPGAYAFAGGSEPLRVVQTSIAVRGEPARSVTLRFTRHGPVVHEDAAGNLFAVRAAWLLPGMAPYFGSIEYMRAGNWDQFHAALNRWGAPAENQVYADVDGNIGYRAAGYFPRRLTFDGLLPVPGDGRFEWEDAFDMDALPSLYNPPAGWVATANALTLPPDYPIDARRVGFEWTPPWRQGRLEQVLTADDSVTVDDALALQRDYGTLPAQRLLPVLRTLAGRDEAERKALALLATWPAPQQMARTSAPAALFNVWWKRHLLPGYARLLLPDAAAAVPEADSELLVADLTATPLPAARRALLLQTLGSAWHETERLLGADATRWRWGDLHRIRFQHPLHAIAPPALQAQLALPDFPRGGNTDTPNATTYDDAGFDVRSGASFRMVLDVGNWDAARMTNAPGQSGDPRSPFYGSLLEGWANEESFPMLYTRAAIEAATVQRLRLRPAPAPTPTPERMAGPGSDH